MKSNTTTNTMTRRGLQLQKLLQPQQEEGAYILCTRYKVQTEMKMLFDSCFIELVRTRNGRENKLLLVLLLLLLLIRKRNSNNGTRRQQIPTQHRHRPFYSRMYHYVMFINSVISTCPTTVKKIIYSHEKKNRDSIVLHDWYLV